MFSGEDMLLLLLEQENNKLQTFYKGSFLCGVHEGATFGAEIVIDAKVSRGLGSLGPWWSGEMGILSSHWKWNHASSDTAKLLGTVI